MTDEPKKLTTAEILALARKNKGAGGGDSPAPAESAPAEGAKSPPPAEKKPAAAKPEAAKPASSKPTETAGKPGERPSVSDILAMARAAKAGGGEAKPAAAKPAEEKPKPAPKPAAEAKPAAKPAAGKAEAGKTPAAALDTASILAAARGGAKPGPMSKAEAAQKGAPVEPAAKPKLVAPPMPAKPEYAKSKAVASVEERRTFLETMVGSAAGLGFAALAVTHGLWALGSARFMFPNTLNEPPSKFKVGFPESFSPGTVEEKFKAQFGVWVVSTEYNGQPQIYALKTVCTHLGCTPNWLEAEQKYKCPCHGSGFYKDGINFEGPAPRPLERYAIRLAEDGQIEIDRSRTFQEELGQWSDPASFIARTV